MAEESTIKMMPTDEVIDAKIVAALEGPLRKLSEHDKSLAGKADNNSVYDKTTVDSKVKATGDAISEHVANNTRHITDSEREIWNNKPDSSEIYTRQQSDQRFSHVSHEHTNDEWFTSAINAVKALIPTLPSWLTPTREEPPTKKDVESKYTKPSGGIPLSDMEVPVFPPESHSHASDGWFTTAINSKADEAKPSFSTITINGVDYTEWTLGTKSGKIMLSVDMGGTSTEIAAFNPVTGVFVSAPSQYRNTLRFDGKAPVVGASPTLFDHVARESALDGKLDDSHNTDSLAHNDIRTALGSKRDYDDRSWGNLVSGVKSNGDYSVIMEERDGAHYYRKIPDSIGSDDFAEYKLFLTEATGDEQNELWVYQVRHFINGGSEMDLDVSSVSNGGFIENTITVTGEAGNMTFVKGYYRIDSFALISDIPNPVKVIDPASATEAGKAADALATKNALDGMITADYVTDFVQQSAILQARIKSVAQSLIRTAFANFDPNEQSFADLVNILKNIGA